MQNSQQNDQPVTEDSQLAPPDLPGSDDRQNANIRPRNCLPECSEHYATYIPRPDMYRKGESTADCIVRHHLQRHINQQNGQRRFLNMKSWLYKTDLDELCAEIPAYRNERCDRKMVVCLEEAIWWYKRTLGDKEKCRKHLREAYDAYAASPHHQVELPYTNEIATLENQRGHRAFNELPRVNAIILGAKDLICNTRQFTRQISSYYERDQPSVKHARKRLAELEKMNLEKRVEFSEKMRLETVMIRNDIKTERERFPFIPSFHSIDKLKNELKGLTRQLTKLYIGMKIPRKSIVLSPGKYVKRPRITELRRIFDKMHKEFMGTDTMPDAEERVHRFLVEFMFPMPPPRRVYRFARVLL